MNAFIDSDILIRHLRGKVPATDFLRNIRRSGEYQLCLGAMQRAEILFFMRNNEKDLTLSLLSFFRTVSVTQEIVDQAGVLFRKFNPSHGIDPNDAILAATTIIEGGQLFTLNMKHYPMPDVVVRKAW